MLDRIKCPKCRATLRMQSKPEVGKTLKCPKCQQPFRYRSAEDHSAAHEPLSDETEPAGSSSGIGKWLIFGSVLCVAVAAVGYYAVTRLKAGGAGQAQPVAAGAPGEEANPLAGQNPIGGAPAEKLAGNIDQGHQPAEGIRGNQQAAKPAAQPIDLARPARLEGNGDGIFDVEFSPDARKLAVFTAHGGIALWDLATREQLTLAEPEQRSYTKYSKKVVSFTADGGLLLAGFGSEVRVWDTVTGKLKHRLGNQLKENANSTVHAGFVALSLDGRSLVTVEYPGDASVRYHVWDVGSGKERFHFDWKELAGDVEPQFSPDGRLLSVRADGVKKLLMFDVETGKQLPPHNFEYDSIVLLAKPSRLIGWKGREYFEWEMKPDGSLQLKHKFELPADTAEPYRPIVATPDGRTLAFPDGRLWDVAARKVVTGSIPGAQVPVQRAPDGNSLLAWTNNNENLELIEVDPATGEIRVRHEFGKRKFVIGFSEPIAASRDGQVAAIGSSDGVVHLKPLGANGLATFKLVAEMSLAPNGPNAFSPTRGPISPQGILRFTPDGRFLIFSSTSASSLWDVATRKFLYNIVIPPVLLYRDKLQAEIGNAGAARLVETQNEAPLSVTLVPGASSLWVTGKGKWVLLTSSETLNQSDHFRLFEFPVAGDPGKSLPIDPTTFHIPVKYTIAAGIPKGPIDVGFMRLQPVSDPFEAHRLEASPDGKMVLGVVRTIQHKLVDRGADKAPGVDELSTPPFHLALLDASTRKEQAVLVDNYDDRLGVFSPDGKLVALPSRDGIRLWDVSTHQEIVNGAKPGDSVAFTHDGKTLGVMGHGNLALYDIATSQLQREIDLNRGHTGVPQQAVFSPTAPVFASADYDGYLLLRELERGDVLVRRAAHTAPCDGVAFSPDGKIVATLSVEEKTIKLWEVPADLKGLAAPGNNELQVIRFTPKQPPEVPADANVATTEPDVPAATENPKPTVNSGSATKPTGAKSTVAKTAVTKPSVTKNGRQVITNSIGMKLVQLPAGEFQMGAPASDGGALPNEQPQHQVRITKPFAIGMHEVTIGQFKSFVEATGHQTDAEQDGMGAQGYDVGSQQVIETWQPNFTWKSNGFPQSDNHPVINVSWNDAKAFCAWLTGKEGKKYRLPTEAEWEYACRAGTTTLYWTGDPIPSLEGAENLGDASLKQKWNKAEWVVSWDDGHPFSAPVGSFKPNPWGLYDMHGNVAERVEDRYAPNFYSHSPDTDPQGSSTGENRIVRAGSWYNDFWPLRSTFRLGEHPPNERNAATGFRVVREP